MSEELIQNNFQNTTIGTFTYYSIGATTLRQLARNNIIPKLDYSPNENKKPDGLVLKSGLPFAILEWKEATKIKSQRGLEKAISQELCVAQVMNAKILIICSDKNTYFFNVSNGEKIEIEGFNEYDKFIFNESFVKIFELISENLTSKTLRIQEKPKEYLNPIILSKQVWQDLWTVNGATPENALYTFVEFFIFKYLSDLKILRGMFSFQHLLNSYKENTEDEVLENYVRTIRPRMKELFPNSESDGTTIINGTIFVSKDQKAVQGYSATFKKILQRFYEFGELKNIDYDFKSLLFESFLKQSISKKNWGQFFTPLTVVNEVVEMADSYLKDGVKVCDPACGVGKFLLSSIADRDNYSINNKKVESKINIYGFDKGFDHDEQKTIILAKANMLIYLTDFIKENATNTDIIAKEIFNKSFILETNSILGTLSHTTREEYDLILTNPPYVSSGTSNLREEIKKDKELSAYYGNYGLGIESLFIEWIVNSLKKGGTAFIVIPDSFFIRQQDKKLRDYVRSECIIEAVISLPEKTFFTTLKKTSILVIKKRDGSTSQKDFMYYLVSEIGETRDVNRFKIKDNDLKKSTAVFKIFNSGAENIEQYIVDERFKLVSDQFLENDIWNFEQSLYSEQKLGQFGRINQNKKLSIADYIYSIDEKNTLISSLMEEMKVVEAVESKKKTIRIGDYYKHVPSNAKLTKKLLENMPGEVPVYASSKSGTAIGKISRDIPNLKIYNQCISYNRNGSAGYFFYRVHEFAPTEDHNVLLKKTSSDSILDEYVVFKLNENSDQFSWGNKAGKSKVENLFVDIPCTNQGEFDIEKQKLELVGMRALSRLRIDIENNFQTINETEILFKEIDENEQNKLEFALKELTSKIVLGSSKYTMKYVKDSKGIYPLYSSKTTEKGKIGYVDAYDLNGDYITWTKDGYYAGTVFYREKEKFSMTTHCGALEIVNKEIRSYVYYYLKNHLKEYAVGEQNKRVSKATIENIKITLPMIGGKIDSDKLREVNLINKNIEKLYNEIKNQAK